MRCSQAGLCRSGHCCKRPDHPGLHREHPRGNALPLRPDERGQGLVGVHLRDHQDAPRPNVWPLPSQIEDSSRKAYIPNPRFSSFQNLQPSFKPGIISGMKPEEMVNLTSNAVQEMIDQHQQLPGSVKRVCALRQSLDPKE